MADEQDKFDAIVVGAGPAGCACAYALAKQGKNVLLVERGTPRGARMFPAGGYTPTRWKCSSPGCTSALPCNARSCASRS